MFKCKPPDEVVGPYMYYRDPAGNTIKFFNYNGLPFSTFPGDQVTRMERLPHLKARPDDVYICGYLKSGTNWVWEIASMILSGTTEYVPRSKLTTMLEYTDQKDFEALPPPRILNTHVLLRDLPQDVLRKRSRIIYLLRNPKDVLVSHFHHNFGLRDVYEYNGDWTNYFELWLDGKVDCGCWFEYVKHWEEQLKHHPSLNVHVIYYENLKLNFTEEAKKLSHFLGVVRDDSYLERLTHKCNIQAMRSFKTTCFTEAEHNVWRGGKANFFRKGIIGDWLDHFTVNQNRRFDAVIKDRLEGSDLKFVYEE